MKDIVRRARLRLLRMHFESGVGHIGGNLSALDILLTLHHRVMGEDDRFVLSKGHAAGALYVTLWTLGRLHEDELGQFHGDDSRLGGHPLPQSIPEISFASGSLGHGLGLAAGMALGTRLLGRPGRVFCLLSDGEWNEGSTWESLIFVSHHHVREVILIVDQNGLQGFGTTAEVANLQPLENKLREFGFEIRQVDGHDTMAVEQALTAPAHDRPVAILARTIKGHGVSFMEEQTRVALPNDDAGAIRPGRRGSPPPVRALLAEALVAHARAADFVFLTGDVGFMALEPLRNAAKERFINAGIAEQNMVSVAAGLAAAGLRPWVYSIAPFLYARAFEQIRNDVCMHNLPVFLVGNGGGYAYGAMGPTHHAIEDYGSLLGLGNLSAYIPAFGDDVLHVVARVMASATPAYVRLGRDEAPLGIAIPSYAPWRKILSGRAATLVALGPLAGGLLGAARGLPESERPTLWVLSELPIVPEEIPSDFIDDFQRSGHLIVVEEHVAQGSAGAAMARALMLTQTVPRRFSHRFACAHPVDRTGSQRYHRQMCGLDLPSILRLSSVTS